MLSDYFNFLKKVAINNPDVLKFRLIKEFIGVRRGFIRFALELRDGTELHVFENVDSGLHKIDYSYHWQNNDKNLLQRWDNAPHHVKIKTFLHHLHNGEDIMPSEEPTFVEILEKIGERIYKK